MTNADDNAHMIHRHVNDKFRAEWLKKQEANKGTWRKVYVEEGFKGAKPTWHVLGVQK